MASDISPDQEHLIQTGTLDALREGLASIERGEGISLEEADQRLRAKHGISRS